MQVRPAAAAAFFAERADLLTDGHASAELHRRVEREEVRVAVIPAALVEHPDGVVVLVVETGGHFVIGDHGGSDGDYTAGSRRGDVHQSFGAAGNQCGRIIKLAPRDFFATV